MCNIVTMKRDAVDSLQPSVRCRCSVLDMLFHSNVVTRATSNLSIALFLLVFFNSFNKMPENWPLEKKKGNLLSSEHFGVCQLIDSFVPN